MWTYDWPMVNLTVEGVVAASSGSTPNDGGPTHQLSSLNRERTSPWFGNAV